MGTFTPTGTADGNGDAVRQSTVAAWFNSIEGLLTGIDDSPRASPATQGSQVLGFGESYGIDVGVGNNGDFYLRGRAGQADPASSSSSSTAAPAVARIPPALLLLAVAAAAYLILRK